MFIFAAKFHVVRRLCYRKKENRRKTWAADESDEQLVYNGHVDVSLHDDVSDDVSDDVRYRQSASNNSAPLGRRQSEPISQFQLSRKVLVVLYTITNLERVDSLYFSSLHTYQFSK